MPQKEVGRRAFDLTPHPRILRMLGEIHLKQWQCIAELADNAVDSFIESKRAKRPIANPYVRIDLPTSAAKGARITVRDNGPGMSWETLEKAAKAGWTSHNPFDNLGLFGMGFNVATARLGNCTRLWTTREGDDEWVGLVIDFEQLSAKQSFATPAVTRPKNDSKESGTEVVIEQLKPDQLDWLSKSQNRSTLARQLGRVYSSMLATPGVPVGFRLELNSRPVRAERHCVWGDTGGEPRAVQTARLGAVNAFQTVDVRLTQRPFCTRCWVWLGPGEAKCSSCDQGDSIVHRERRIHGWLGVQRYLDPEKFGIDLLRNGRKIEIGCKDLFKWEDEQTGTEVVEYPIDDPRGNGRIVGEIHLDHGSVPYTKNQFLREDSAWQDMVQAVRGAGPLRPLTASDRGYGENKSPLYALFQAFRRNNVHNRRSGGWDKLLLVPDNDKAKSMAKYFDAGEPDYQSDEKWWALVEEAEKAVLRSTQTSSPEDRLGGDSTSGEDGGASSEAGSTPAEPPKREPLVGLSSVYQDDLTRQTFDVRAYSVQATHPLLTQSGSPWIMTRCATGQWEFYVDIASAAFRSMTLTPLDALLAEIAWHSADMERSQQARWSFGAILASLRAKHTRSTTLDPVAMNNEARLRLSDIARVAQQQSNTRAASQFYLKLAPAEKNEIQVEMATRGGADPKSAIRDGRFLVYASPRVIRDFVLENPEIYFDGKYWDDEYLGLDFDSLKATKAAQSKLKGRYHALLSDLEWLTLQPPDDLGDYSREELMRAMLAIPLLEPTAARQE